MRTIVIDDQAALVLFDFLAREIGDRKAAGLETAINHPAEICALNTVLSSLESILPEPFVASYADLVAKARARLIEEGD